MGVNIDTSQVAVLHYPKDIPVGNGTYFAFKIVSMKLHLIFAVLSFAFFSGTAVADTFAFSYTFDDVYGAPIGMSARGTFTGTQIGDSVTGYVTGVVIDSLNLGGIDILGQLGGSEFFPAPAPPPESQSPLFLSFDLAQNSFVLFAFDSGNNNQFILVRNFASMQFTSDPASVAVTYIADDAHGVWSLTNTSSVTDASATIALLGFAMISLAALRRKFDQA